MDPKDLEDKLEKDNLTLKEHILKLQSTIKNIKTELSNTNNNNTTYVNTLSHLDDFPKNKNLKKESPKQNNSKKTNIMEDSDDEINHLKFSFKNIKAEQKLIDENKRKKETTDFKKDEENPKTFKNKKLSNEVEESNVYNPSHFYKDNLQKLKNEKDLIRKMERVKDNTNLRKKYDNNNSEKDDEEFDRFHKLNNISQKQNKIESKNPGDYNNFIYNKYNIQNKKEERTNYSHFNNDSDPDKNSMEEDKYSYINKESQIDIKYNSIPKYKNSKTYFFLYI